MSAEQTSPSSSRRGPIVLALAVGLGLLGLAIRVPFIRRVGPIEGGGDEWWSVWRAWSVVYEGGKPGNYLHPALYYDLGALWFRGLSGQLADFVSHQYEYVRQLEYLSALCGAITVSIVFLLGCRLFGTLAGVLAAGMICVLPLHIVYSQAARVDALATLTCALFWLGLLRADHSGRMRDSAIAGGLLGLVVSANYPGALLVLPFVWLHVQARRWGALGVGTVVALVVFVATNPALLTEPRLVWEGFLFQAGMAAHAHPGREGVGADFYLQVLRDQGWLLVVIGAVAVVAMLARGARFPRLMAATALIYLLSFALLKTQFDRYILPPLPWVCVLIAGLLVRDGLSRWVRVGGVVLALSIVAESGWHARSRIAPDYQRTEPMPAEVAQRWLMEHAQSGERIWLDADILPLLQAVFADPGGPLHDALQGAFRQAAPSFNATFIKGERIEGFANFSPELLKTVRWTVACDRAADGAAPEQRAFYEALKSCPVALTFDEQCAIRQCSSGDGTGR